MSTLFLTLLAIAGVILVVGGLASLVLLVRWMRSGRRARRLPVRRPEPGLVLPAVGRVYVSRAAGARRARDRVVASPVLEAGATTYLIGSARAHRPVSRLVRARAGRHRDPAGVAR